MNFKFRSERIIEEIGSSPADIICLQEVDHIDDFYDEKLKKLGYNVVYGQRKPGPAFEHKATAICYKSDDWVLIDTEKIDF